MDEFNNVNNNNELNNLNSDVNVLNNNINTMNNDYNVQTETVINNVYNSNLNNDVVASEVKVYSDVRKVDVPDTTSRPLTKEEKEIQILKQQKEFEVLVQKAREEEKRRTIEQQKIQKEREARAIEKAKREEEKRLKEDEQERIRDEKIENMKKNGEAVTVDEKINRLYKKVTYSKKQMLELEAKKVVLEETIRNATDITRYTAPILFDYIAKNSKGEFEKSSIEALSKTDIYSFLETEGYEVYDIVVSKSNNSTTLFNTKIKNSRLIFYLSQLSAYIKSGIALADAVKIITEQATNKNEQKVWKSVYYDLSMGDNLSVALEKRKDSFPKLLVNMIKTAELTGDLTATLDDMVEYYTETESTRKQVKSAMTYPLVVSVFAIVVTIFILMWVVPQFADLYKDLDSELPGITKFVMMISNFLQNYMLWIGIIIIILLILYIYLFKNVKSFRRTMQFIMMKIPVMGEIIIYSEVNIFAKTFANLLNHNVFITDSIDVLGKITENEIYKKLIAETTNNLTRGEALSKAFENHWAFPPIAYQMLITGEKTGRLGTMMEKVSDYFQESHRTIINQLKSLVEPILIVSLAVIVGGILISVILPMYGMFENI